MRPHEFASVNLKKTCSMCKLTYNVSVLGVWHIYIYILPTESDSPKNMPAKKAFRGLFPHSPNP